MWHFFVVVTSYIVTSIDQVFQLFHKIGRKRDSLLLQNLNMAQVLTQPNIQWEPNVPCTGVK
jgi:hypothetical protein